MCHGLRSGCRRRYSSVRLSGCEVVATDASSRWLFWKRSAWPLALWQRSTELARCGLYHSAYSNSYVNLAIFDINGGDRTVVRDDLGEAAEALVYKFCTIPRHELLTKALPPMLPAEGGGGVPAAGVTTRHIVSGEAVHLSRAELHDFLVFQIADVAKPLGSVSKMCDNGNVVTFTKQGGTIKHIESGTVTQMRREGALYVVDVKVNRKDNEEECFWRRGK